MTSYVRLRFRDDVGSREKLPARLSEGEEELARMLVTLERAGRLVPRAGGVESASSQPPHGATPSASGPLDTATGWSEARVQRWLHRRFDDVAKAAVNIESIPVSGRDGMCAGWRLPPSLPRLVFIDTSAMNAGRPRASRNASAADGARATAAQLEALLHGLKT